MSYRNQYIMKCIDVIKQQLNDRLIIVDIFKNHLCL